MTASTEFKPEASPNEATAVLNDVSVNIKKFTELSEAGLRSRSRDRSWSRSESAVLAESESQLESVKFGRLRLLPGAAG